MSALKPHKQWWSASQIAKAGLPDLPNTRQGVEKLAKQTGWRNHPKHATQRTGKGGGWEYSWELFPQAARRKLLKAASVQDQPTPCNHAVELQRYYEGLPDRTKAKTKERHKVLLCILELERTGLTRFVAVTQVALDYKISERTIWNWFSFIDGVARKDWLYHLAPRNRLGARRDKKAPHDPAFFDRLKTLYLRPEAPTFAQCYRDAEKIAHHNGWEILAERTARRRLDELVPRVVQVYAREGEHGLARCFPPLTRDKTQMHAMQGVNADCHKFDVFVRWPDDKVERCQIIAFQDLYSDKILSWRIDHTPNEVAVMAAFGEMVETYGIPQHCTFDNGREFASKWLSGGAKTRYRGKIRDDDPLGVLPLLGIQIHWAQPGHGQAKPIERAFRDLASDIAKDIRFAGAYVGNRPDAKPENYGSNAIPIERFIRVVDERIKEHNARAGRRTATALGRSFDDTFNDSYAQSAIQRASDEQSRLWLMGQKTLTLQKGHGRAHLFGNYYWSDWMAELAGTKVVVRFDIEDLHTGAYFYELTGEYLGFAPCQQATGFYDLRAAKDNARAKAAYRRAQKRLLERERAIDPNKIASELDGIGVDDPIQPEHKIVQLPKGDHRPAAARATRPDYQEPDNPKSDAEVLAFQDAFYAEQKRQQDAAKSDEPIDRFKRAIDLEAKLNAGQPVGEAEVKWLTGYQTSSEYRGFCKMYEDYGQAMFVT